MLECGKGIVRLVVLDFGAATSILDRPEARDLTLERDSRTLAARGITPAARQVVFDSRDAPAIDERKIEGVTILGPSDVALSSDNDFGVAGNTSGTGTKLWRVRLARPLPLDRTQ